MATSENHNSSGENILSVPDKLVWSLILMGVMVLITFVSQ